MGNNAAGGVIGLNGELTKVPVLDNVFVTAFSSASISGAQMGGIYGMNRGNVLCAYLLTDKPSISVGRNLGSYSPGSRILQGEGGSINFLFEKDGAPSDFLDFDALTVHANPTEADYGFAGWQKSTVSGYDAVLDYSFGGTRSSEYYEICRNGMQRVDQDVIATFGKYVTLSAVADSDYAITPDCNELYSVQGGAIVDGAGRIPANSIVHLTVLNATTLEGYRFAGWYDGEARLSANLTHNFRLPARNVSIVADFVKTWVVSFAYRTNAGVVVVRKTVDDFGTVPTPPVVSDVDGYTTDGKWYLQGADTVLDPTLTVSKNITFEIRYTPRIYSIVARSSSNLGYVTLNGKKDLLSTILPFDSEIVLRAYPVGDSKFVCWMRDGEQIATTEEFVTTVDGGTTFVAYFTNEEYSFSYSWEEGGTVLSSEALSGTGNVRVGMLPKGREVTLVAEAAAGYVFEGWEVDGVMTSQQSAISVSVTETTSYHACFTQFSYVLTTSKNIASAGTILGGGNYPAGRRVTVTAVPAVGFTFLNWTQDGQIVSTELSYNVLVNEDVHLVANFKQMTYLVTFKNGNAVLKSEIVLHGENATPPSSPSKEGYTFTGWDGSFLNVTSARDIQAKFAVNEYRVSVRAENPDRGSVIITPSLAEGKLVPYGKQLTVTAAPSAEYIFDGWFLNEICVSTNLSYTFVTVGNINLVARFSVAASSISLFADKDVACIGDEIVIYATVYPTELDTSRILWDVASLDGKGSAALDEDGNLILTANVAGKYRIDAIARDGSNVYESKTVEFVLPNVSGFSTTSGDSFVGALVTPVSFSGTAGIQVNLPSESLLLAYSTDGGENWKTTQTGTVIFSEMGTYDLLLCFEDANGVRSAEPYAVSLLVTKEEQKELMPVVDLILKVLLVMLIATVVLVLIVKKRR